MGEQLVFDLKPRSEDDLVAWSPRDLWNNLTADLLPLLREDRRAECKIASVHLDELARYYSMWSNTADGGVLLVGVDKRYAITGCRSAGQNKINDIEKLHTNFCPLAKPQTRQIAVTVDGKPDIVVAVYLPYIGKLVETNRHEAFIRYGDSIHKMTEEEKHDFRSSRHELSFEQEPCGLNYPADFDPFIIAEFCDAYKRAENLAHRSDEEVLELAQLGRRDGQSFVPSNALALVAAKSPRNLFPGCRVRIQRFEGLQEGTGDTYSPIINKWIDGNVVEMIRRSREYIETILYDFTWMKDGNKFITGKEYPFSAWYEAVVNACVHRSYSFSGSEITIKFFDTKLVIESPGGFCPPVNERNIYAVRASRNPIICGALYYLGLTRMAREGTRRMLESMREWQLPEPKFEQEAIHGVVVRVTLENDKEMRKRVLDKDVVEHFGINLWKELTTDEMKVAAYAYRNETINVSEAQRVIGRTWKTSKNALERLKRRGILEFVPGEYERDSKTHYRIKPREKTDRPRE